MLLLVVACLLTILPLFTIQQWHIHAAPQPKPSRTSLLGHFDNSETALPPPTSPIHPLWLTSQIHPPFHHRKQHSHVLFKPQHAPSWTPAQQHPGGGIAVIYHNRLKLRPISIPLTSSFEHLVFRLPGSRSLLIAIIYRPPQNCSSFLSDFTDFYTQLSSISPCILLLGDFNIHIDTPSSKFTPDFLDILHCLDLTQHINSPTHSHGHILDLVCSSAPLSVHNLTLSDLAISDHRAITMDIVTPTPTPSQIRSITFRNLKSLNPISFSSFISESLSRSSLSTDSTTIELVDHYNQSLSSCLNQLAPLKAKTVSFSASAPWYTPDLHQLKCKRRQLERLHKKTGLTVHADVFKHFTSTDITALNTARSNYFSQIIHSNASNPRTLFTTFAQLTKPKDNITSTFTTNKCNNYL
ncbi:hypothetical protein JOB18_017353 [Solea senegalensis]|uniref:Endonuclease/exonuclease/phosphatase domain-containing protein n=1 Tax=Solea senegalensis TaxID=28829 RepID=A0AAV6R0G7_SOLSE|nr:hypothetical protein JOB18_017353 [Solea senegalensis]